jgi:hypothetical protein
MHKPECVFYVALLTNPLSFFSDSEHGVRLFHHSEAHARLVRNVTGDNLVVRRAAYTLYSFTSIHKKGPEMAIHLYRALQL